MPDIWWFSYAVPGTALLLAGAGKAAATGAPGPRSAPVDELTPALLQTPLVERGHAALELAVGSALLLAPTPLSRTATASAAVMLGGYLAVASRGYRRGVRTCACYGALGEGRLSAGSLARTAALTLAATAATWHARCGGSAPAVAGNRRWGTATVAGTVTVAIAAAQQRHRRHRRHEELHPDAAAMRLTLTSGCGPCEYLRRHASGSDRIHLVEADAGTPAPVAALLDRDGRPMGAEITDPHAIATLAAALIARTAPAPARERADV